MNSGCIWAEPYIRMHLFLRSHKKILSVITVREKEEEIAREAEIRSYRVSSILVNGVFMHRPVCGSIYYYKTVSAVWKEPAHRQVIDNTIKFLLMRRKRNASVVVKNLTSFPCFDALSISSDSLRSSLQIYAAYCGWGKTEVGKVFGIVSYMIHISMQNLDSEHAEIFWLEHSPEQSKSNTVTVTRIYFFKLTASIIGLHF